nr:hypothetical protein Iba_chr05bCG5050 [Ipomoea batatas]
MPFILKLHPRIYWVDTASPVADVKPIDTDSTVDINSYMVAINIIKLTILECIELHCHHMIVSFAIGVGFIKEAKIWVGKCSRKTSWWCNGKGKAIADTWNLGHDSTDKGSGEGESRDVGLSKPLEVIWAIPSRLRLAELNPLNLNSRSPDVAKHSCAVKMATKITSLRRRIVSLGCRLAVCV